MRKFREMLVGGNEGFTLIELLVVIAVLGILAGIAVPRLTGVTDRAKKTEAVSALGSIKTAIEVERLEDSNLSLGALLPKYLDGANANSWEGWTINSSPSGAFTTANSFTITMTKDEVDGDVTLNYTSGTGYEIND